MPKDARDVVAGLVKKGFQKKENDHTFLQLYVDGLKTPIYTKVSHGEKEIGDKLLSAMARQVQLTRRQFVELIECPLTGTAYVEMLRTKQAIS